MTALSLHLPDHLARESQNAARSLGLSRSSFIRQAIEHELQQLMLKKEQNALLRSFTALCDDPTYMKEAQEIDEALSTALPDESEEWWKK
jgi:metal-responsive CopG/Arc/MetJ family transcriptional regulator